MPAKENRRIIPAELSVGYASFTLNEKIKAVQVHEHVNTHDDVDVVVHVLVDVDGF